MRFAFQTQASYFNARWYHPDTGRFITEDPARDGSNWYVYCSQNPLIYVDPTGLEFIELGTGFLDTNENYYYDEEYVSLDEPSSSRGLWASSFGQGPQGRDVYVAL